MPRSRGRPKLRQPPPRRRWNWRRVFGGVAEFFRNFALLAFGAPFAEPLLTGAPVDWARAAVGAVFGLALMSVALILDHERRD